MRNFSQISPLVTEILQFKIFMLLTFLHRYISVTNGPIWLKFCMQVGYKSRQLPAKFQPNRSKDAGDMGWLRTRAMNTHSSKGLYTNIMFQIQQQARHYLGISTNCNLICVEHDPSSPAGNREWSTLLEGQCVVTITFLR